MVLAATAQQDAVQIAGCAWAGKSCRRGLNDDRDAIDRSKPGALIHDERSAGERYG